MDDNTLSALRTQLARVLINRNNVTGGLAPS